MKIILSISFSCILAIYNCQERSIKSSAPRTINIKGEQTVLRYQLDIPDQVMTLSGKLKEISGLTYDVENDHLLAVNDEQGKIYHLDKGTGDIIEIEDFGKRGDYEGIEKVGDEVYVLKSNGHIYVRDTTDKKGSQTIRTELREANDVEGLGYDKVSHSLLLACKGKPKIMSEQKLKNSKVVYALDIKNKVCSKDPFLKINDDDLYDFVQNYYKTSDSSSTNKKLLKRVKSFAPSAIGHHLKDDHFYLLSSVGKLLVVVNRDSKVVAVSFLDSAVHTQPEGICFNQYGELFISNEGTFGIAKIYKYKEIQ